MEPEDIEKLKESLKDHFSSLETPKINSFYFKLIEGQGQQTRNAPQLLFGDECITETVLGLKFRISPDAFFQINAKATEV
jgi:tRNA (uracil-5-)-methyltransferase